MKGEPELVALVENREMGRVRRDRNGRLSFAYAEDWRTAADAFPLSLSMPLALGEHGHAKIDPYLWGLLPDNEQVFGQVGTQVSRFGAERVRADRACGRGCAGGRCSSCGPSVWTRCGGLHQRTSTG
jgi:serine/threonine-protein kinase HipA